MNYELSGHRTAFDYRVPTGGAINLVGSGYRRRKAQDPAEADRVGRHIAEPRRARVMEVAHLEIAIAEALKGNSPESDELKLLLSFYAGLRVAEIAELTYASVADASGQVGNKIWVASSQTKNGRERTIPMHPRIRDSIVRFRRRHPDIDYFAFSYYGPRKKRQTSNAVCQWFRRIYIKAGLEGCSSHSGRRSFITHLARSANAEMCSLHDVQRLVGHARLDTTQAYIEPSPTVMSLVNSLGNDSASRKAALLAAILN